MMCMSTTTGGSSDATFQPSHSLQSTVELTTRTWKSTTNSKVSTFVATVRVLVMVYLKTRLLRPTPRPFNIPDALQQQISRHRSFITITSRWVRCVIHTHYNYLMVLYWTLDLREILVHYRIDQYLPQNKR